MHQPICIALLSLCLLNNGYIWWHHCTKQRSTGRLISHSHCSKLLCVSIKLEECLISSNDECAVWQMRMLCRPQSDQWIALEKVGRSKLETTAQHRHQWKVFLVGDVMETNSVPDDNVDVLDRSVPASEPTRRLLSDDILWKLCYWNLFSSIPSDVRDASWCLHSVMLRSDVTDRSICKHNSSHWCCSCWVKVVFLLFKIIWLKENN